MSDFRPENPKVLVQLVTCALEDLSNLEFQREVWVLGSNTELSSLNEVASALYDDSGLSDALDRDTPVFSKSIDNDLRVLRTTLRPFVIQAAEMTGSQVGDLIASPEWQLVARTARCILGDIRRRA